MSAAMVSLGRRRLILTGIVALSMWLAWPTTHSSVPDGIQDNATTTPPVVCHSLFARRSAVAKPVSTLPALASTKTQVRLSVSGRVGWGLCRTHLMEAAFSSSDSQLTHARARPNGGAEIRQEPSAITASAGTSPPSSPPRESSQSRGLASL